MRVERWYLEYIEFIKTHGIMTPEWHPPAGALQYRQAPVGYHTFQVIYDLIALAQEAISER